jgi:hypothetical protein
MADSSIPSVAANSFDRLTKALQTIVPFQVRYKDQSRAMRLLNLVVRWFNPTFMTHFASTIGYTVYFPSRQYVLERPVVASQILLHEAVHLLDQKKYSVFLFIISYLYPQILLLGIFSFPWTGYKALIFLLFALPLPSFWRTHWESRAYALSLMIEGQTEEDWEATIDMFAGWDYYKMFPFRAKCRKMLEYWVAEIEDGEDKILSKLYLLYQEQK